MKAENSKNRIRVLTAGACVCFAVFAFRLAQWQIVEHEELKNAAVRTSTHIQKIESSRGEIVDRYGIPLVVNKSSFDLVLDKALLYQNDKSVVLKHYLSLLQKTDTKYADLLPISKTQPYEFLKHREKDIKKLRKKLGASEIDTAPILMEKLKDKYKLDGYDEKTVREIIGIRYTSEIKKLSALKKQGELDGFIVIDKRAISQAEENFVIDSLLNVLSKTGESHIDELPISMSKPYEFLEGRENDVAKLKKRVGVGEYADAELCMYHLKEKYGAELYDEERNREIVGVRYTSELKDFSLSNPYTFAEDLKTETGTIIMENSMRLKGAYINEKEKRSYPNGDVAPHIIGQVGPIFAEERDLYTAEKGYNLSDKVGKSGIEKAFESVLKGKDGKRQIVLDNRGELTEILENQPAEPGNTVVLTIDSKLQQCARNALQKKIQMLNQNAAPKRGKEADAGAVVVLDVKTGEVLAAVNYPSYDLANYNKDFEALSKDPRRPLWDRTILGQYAPGSVFKPCVGVAALSEGIMKKDDTVFCNHIYDFYDDPTFRPSCVGRHGNIEITRAIQESCNIYFYDVGRRLGTEKINEYANKLGLGVETGVELPENIGRLTTPELFSSLRNGEPWTPGNTLQASIGQMDTRFTPIQIANYTATLANKGKRMDLNLVKSIESYNMDKTISKTEPKVAFDGSGKDYVYDAIREGMVKASRIGTASAFFKDYPMDVASKTGSPQVSKEITNSVFTCYAPADDPQIAITVVIEKGCHGLYGAPVARDILDFYFKDEAISPGTSEQGMLLP